MPSHLTTPPLLLMQQNHGLKAALMQPKIKMWQGMEEGMAKFYVASIVLALDYLHSHNIVRRGAWECPRACLSCNEKPIGMSLIGDSDACS